MKIQITKETVNRAKRLYRNSNIGSNCYPVMLTLKDIFPKEKNIEAGFWTVHVGTKRFNLSGKLMAEVYKFTVYAVFTPGEYELTERV